MPFKHLVHPRQDCPLGLRGRGYFVKFLNHPCPCGHERNRHATKLGQQRRKAKTTVAAKRFPRMGTDRIKAAFVADVQRQFTVTVAAIVTVGARTQQVIKRCKAKTVCINQHREILGVRVGIAGQVVEHHPALQLQHVAAPHAQTAQRGHELGQADQTALALVLPA